MSDERIFTPVAGQNFEPVPVLKYDYASGIILDVGTSSAASASVIPAGLYKVSVDVDTYYTAGPTPVASASAAGSDYVPSGSRWHEYFDGTTKIATLAKSTAGKMRLIPAQKVS